MEARIIRKVEETRSEALKLWNALEAIKLGATKLQEQLIAIDHPSPFRSLREAVDQFLIERSGEFHVSELRVYIRDNYGLSQGSSINTALHRAQLAGKIIKMPTDRSGRWRILEEWKDKPS